MKGHLDVKELEGYKKADLQKLAKELGVSAEGTIKEIAARCAAVEVEIPDESELTPEEKEAAEQAAAEAKEVAEQAAKEAAAKAAAGNGQTVEVTVRYMDKQLNQIKEAGEVFTVSKDRAAQLVAAEVAKIKE